jgi:1-deoxy-D-xylulose-5-phosphate reductoisomerase
MKRVVVLGATGSIGTQTLDVVRQHPDRLQIVGMTAHRQAEPLLASAAEFGVRNVALMDEAAAQAAGIPGGLQAVIDVATVAEADWVVVAVAGVIGLHPTLAAIRAGKHIALASKEVLVAAGEVVMPLIRAQGLHMTPIDSEHSAIFQCLQGYETDQIESITLTASGGPFRGQTRTDLANVTVEEALNHPTWRMGGKITIDSATLMNKGLEMIEAHWLFGLSMDQVNVVVHPQSVVHSLVTFKDGSALGQLGWPDMRLPIQYALLWPERVASGLRPWNPTLTPTLTFEPVDEMTFGGLRLARQAAAAGGTMPCLMNAANEEAVAQFLAGRCGFLAIADLIESAMATHQVVAPEIEALEAADLEGRRAVRAALNL